MCNECMEALVLVATPKDRPRSAKGKNIKTTGEAFAQLRIKDGMKQRYIYDEMLKGHRHVQVEPLGLHISVSWRW